MWLDQLSNAVTGLHPPGRSRLSHSPLTPLSSTTHNLASATIAFCVVDNRYMSNLRLGVSRWRTPSFDTAPRHFERVIVPELQIFSWRRCSLRAERNANRSFDNGPRRIMDRNCVSTSGCRYQHMGVRLRMDGCGRLHLDGRNVR